MTNSVLDMTPHELMRLGAWCNCLHDAALYIELAQDTGRFLTEGASQLTPFKGKSRNGHLKIQPYVERSMIAAAIILAGSVYKNGKAGPGIAKNTTATLEELRKRAEKYSDKVNGWGTGETSKIMKVDVQEERDGFLAHYDGSGANIHVDPSDGTLSWQAPSPWYDPQAFEKLRMAICAMHKGLSRVLLVERDNLKES